MTVKLAKVQAVAMYRDKSLGAVIDQEAGTAMRLQFQLEDGGVGDILVDAQELFEQVINCMLDRDTTGRASALLSRPDNTWDSRSGESAEKWMRRQREADANAFDRKPPASKAPPDVQQNLKDKFLPKGPEGK